MLTITQRQIDTLQEAGREAYIAELRARVGSRHPALAATLEAKRLDAAVRGAMAAAAAHGFDRRGPMRLWLDLCVGFGSGFAADPLYGWAAEALGDGNPETQMARAEALHARAVAAARAIHGPGDAHTRKALRELARWARAEHAFGDDPRALAVWDMQALHPAKAAHGGDLALGALWDDAAMFCEAAGVSGPRWPTLLTALKFAFGARCVDDPLYGWIGATLRDPEVADPEARFARLERKALVWLDAVLKRQDAEAAS
jgi:hypothetical protein